MKKTFAIILSLLILSVLNCKSTGDGTYRITFDPSIDDSLTQSVWLAYSVPIRNDMVKHYKKNPKAEYITPYKVELDARKDMINHYSRIKKNYDINNSYIEDLIKIQDSGKLSEYVFFSFNNSGSWVNSKKLNKDAFAAWMSENMSGHIPLTLARVEKIN